MLPIKNILLVLLLIKSRITLSWRKMERRYQMVTRARENKLNTRYYSNKTWYYEKFNLWIFIRIINRHSRHSVLDQSCQLSDLRTWELMRIRVVPGLQELSRFPNRRISFLSLSLLISPKISFWNILLETNVYHWDSILGIRGLKMLNFLCCWYPYP